MKEFYFEGSLYDTPSNKAVLRSLPALEEAVRDGRILEGVCHMCDDERNLHIRLGEAEGIIPKNEGAIGVEEGKVRDIALISKVGKRVQFVAESIEYDREKPIVCLSRKKAQQTCLQEYVDTLQPGDVLTSRVTHLEAFGAFVDIGAGITSLIPIDMLSVSRISHPSKRVKQGEVLRCVLKNRSEDKLTLSLREMLGTWEENAARFRAGQTVKGTVRSVEEYGVFIELTPNLAGLAEYDPSLKEDSAVAVYIKAIIPEKMKVKLSVIDTFEPAEREKLHYYFEGDHMDVWRYSPEGCAKVIESVFDK